MRKYSLVFVMVLGSAGSSSGGELPVHFDRLRGGDGALEFGVTPDGAYFYPWFYQYWTGSPPPDGSGTGFYVLMSQNNKDYWFADYVTDFYATVRIDADDCSTNGVRFFATIERETQDFATGEFSWEDRGLCELFTDGTTVIVDPNPTFTWLEFANFAVTGDLKPVPALPADPEAPEPASFLGVGEGGNYADPILRATRNRTDGSTECWIYHKAEGIWERVAEIQISSSYIIMDIAPTGDVLLRSASEGFRYIALEGDVIDLVPGFIPGLCDNIIGDNAILDQMGCVHMYCQPVSCCEEFKKTIVLDPVSGQSLVYEESLVGAVKPMRRVGSGYIYHWTFPPNVVRPVYEDEMFSRIDVDGSGKIDLPDLNHLLSRWNTNACSSDFNRDRRTDLSDLNLLLSRFGSTK